MSENLGRQRLALLKRPVPVLDYAETQIEVIKSAMLGGDLDRAEYALDRARELLYVGRAIVMHRRHRVS